MRDFDRIALVTYSDGARVVQPLAPVSEVRAALRRLLPTVRAGGGTMIPLGLATGANALSDAPADAVRRVVLLSDGQDTSGTPLPVLQRQVEQRARDGATLSALGIGVDYDERFLTAIADSGHGNYEFLREPGQLRAFLAREVQQATTTTVENATAEVALPPGFHLVRAYGASAEATESSVRVPLGSLFRGDERRVVLELALDAGPQGPLGALGVRLSYRAAGREARLPGGALTLAAADAVQDVEASRDTALAADAQATVIAARQTDAVAQWRAGNHRAAQAIVQQNVADLSVVNERAQSTAITAQIAEYQRDQATFGALRADTDEGRAYGLASNAANRGRQQRASGH
jgi:Ca-activated chloride channel family protein